VERRRGDREVERLRRELRLLERRDSDIDSSRGVTRTSTRSPNASVR